MRRQSSLSGSGEGSVKWRSIEKIVTSRPLSRVGLGCILPALDFGVTTSVVFHPPPSLPVNGPLFSQRGDGRTMKRATHIAVLGLVMALGFVTRVVAADCPGEVGNGLYGQI